MNNPSAHNKKSYTKLNKAVKYEVKKWKKKILGTEVEEIELAQAKNNSHELFQMVLMRIQGTIENHLTEEQCGFRSCRGTTDVVFAVRQTIEKARERRIPIHMNCVDFKAAFDTIWREALWKCLRSIGVDKSLVDLIESMYKQTKWSVMVNGKITEWFDVIAGVRQGCLLSPSLSNPFLEYVMKDIQQLDSGIQMGDMRINNIRYADDTTLMELVFENLQISTNELEKACRRWDMKINATKSEFMTEDQQDILLNNTNIEKVEKFVFLGSKVPSIEEDVKRHISRRLKVRIYRALILPIATYGAESWTLRKSDRNKLEVFEMRCLRTTLGVHLLDKISNDEIRQRLDVPSTKCEEIIKRRLIWFGHVLRMPHHCLPYQAFQNDFNGRRPRGRLTKRWTRFDAMWDYPHKRQSNEPRTDQTGA
ncbi:uncharacterized protein LOC115921254 [Strongylocentrotus purpuratus]|uniref:Reverse transcriptase domain-containing protein n=1 Tax=Strongylocentrotus purpuratus TaxID=7668 RepID=A0A7M7NC37_STRPU|nr:uncharacterized protein LOC115921254 [Strongylocentrotus purpuratus]